jgi:4-hydroxy-2-oxoheptanedioate aldolase
MMQSVNKLKEVLEKGEVALGTAVFTNNPAVVEIAGYSGLDFVRLDNEYSWRRDESMEHMIRAATIAEITPILRIDKGDHYLVSKALEIGAGGVLVPDIRTKDEVEELIKAAKFPSKGARGYSNACFSAQWGKRGGEDWIQWSGKEQLVGIMVENEEVMSKLDEIVSMEGLDFVEFGPSDYSLSIGLPGPQKNHPKVQDALKQTVEVAHKYGKPVAVVTGPPLEEEVKKYIDLGCKMIEIGSDVVVLRSIWNAVSNKMREA